MKKIKKIMNKKRLLFIVFLLMTFLISAEEMLKQYQTFKWKPVARAKKYQVVVEQKTSKGSYVQAESVETTDCRVEMLLFPGDYRVSISAFNILNKKASSSPWVSFIILDETEPYLLDNIFQFDSQYNTYTLLRSQTEKLVDTSIQIDIEDEQENEVTTQNLEEDIVKEDIVQEEDIAARDFDNLEMTNRLTVSGRNIFFPETKFSLVPIDKENFKSVYSERTQVDLPIVIRDREQSQLELDIDWTKLFAGYYRFEVLNPGGFSDSIEVLVLPERSAVFSEKSFDYDKRYSVNTLLLSRSDSLQSIEVKGVDFQSDTVFSLQPSTGIPYPFSSLKERNKVLLNVEEYQASVNSDLPFSIDVKLSVDTTLIETGYYQLQAETPELEASSINLLVVVQEDPSKLPEVKNIKTKLNTKDASVNFTVEGEKLAFSISGDDFNEDTVVTLISSCNENGENSKVPLNLTESNKNGKKLVCKAEVGSISNGVFAVMIETPSGTQFSYIELTGKKCKASLLSLTKEEVAEKFLRPENFVTKNDFEDELENDAKMPTQISTDPIILTNLGVLLSTDLQTLKADLNVRVVDLKWFMFDVGSYFDVMGSSLGFYGTMNLGIPIRFFTPYIGAGAGFTKFPALEQNNILYFPFYIGLNIAELFELRYNCNLTKIDMPEVNSSLEYFEDSFSFGINLKLRSGMTIKRVENANVIGKYAYYNCYKLNYINLSDYVTSIGNGAFSYCSSLTNITIPESVKSIGSQAFLNCTKLEDVELSYGLKTIGSQAFKGCKSLTSITIPSSVTKIAADAFDESGIRLIKCEWPYNDNETRDVKFINSFKGEIIYLKLDSIKVENFSTYIDSIASSSRVQNLTLLGTLDSDDYKMIGKSLRVKLLRFALNLTSCKSVSRIPNNSFSSCGGIVSIVLPSTVTQIGQEAFSKCSRLESIIIPDKVKLIGSSAFQQCGKLAKISLPSTIQEINESTFINCIGLKKVTLPKNLQTIKKSSFNNCLSLEQIDIPMSVVSIGDDCFANCSSLKSIELPQDLESLGSSAFYQCESLQTIVLPKKINVIRAYTFFGCSNLTSLIIPENVKRIEEWAFFACTSLTTITIPSSVEVIEEYVFKGCTKLQSIILDWPSTDNTIRDLTGLESTNAIIQYSDGKIYKQ